MKKKICLFFLLALMFQQTTCYNFSFYFNPTNWFTKISSFPLSFFELISRYSLATKHRLNSVETELRTNIQNSHSAVESQLQNLINKHKKKQSEGLGILKELVRKQSDEFSQINSSFQENQEALKKQITDAQNESFKIRSNLSEISEVESRLREQIKESSEDNKVFEKKLIELVFLKNGLEQKIKCSEEKCKAMEVMAANFEEQAGNINNLIRKHLGLTISKNIASSNKNFYVEKGVVSRSPVQLTTNKHMDFLNG